MNWKQVAGLLAGLVLAAFASQAQPYKTIYSDLLTALKTQPLVILLEEESPKELQKLADKPNDLALYKSCIALHNNQLRKLAPQVWTFSPAVEFRPESELAALEKDKKKATPVLSFSQKRWNPLTSPSNGPAGNYIEAKWRILLAGGPRESFALSTPMPANTMTAYDIVSGLRHLLLQTTTEQQATTYEAYNRQSRLADRARQQEYGQRLRTKTLLVDKTNLKEGLTEAELRQSYPYLLQLATDQEIEAAVLAADPRYVYIHNFSYTTCLVDAADGAHLAEMQTSFGPAWGKSDFRVLVKQAK